MKWKLRKTFRRLINFKLTFWPSPAKILVCRGLSKIFRIVFTQDCNTCDLRQK